MTETAAPAPTQTSPQAPESPAIQAEIAPVAAPAVPGIPLPRPWIKYAALALASLAAFWYFSRKNDQAEQKQREHAPATFGGIRP